MKNESADILATFLDILDKVLIPLVLVFLGQWFIRKKEEHDSARSDSEQLGSFLEHLSSENKERRKLALLALTHMRNSGLFPPNLLQAVESIANQGDLEIAAAAQMALGTTTTKKDISNDERTLLFELLLPMKIHFERSKNAFSDWIKNHPTTPNIEIEDLIKNSNSVINNLLTKKWYLLPTDLQNDALKLIEHYEAWGAEYDRLRPGGVRDPQVPYVFVGPKGIPFPRESESNFMEKYKTLVDGND